MIEMGPWGCAVTYLVCGLSCGWRHRRLQLFGRSRFRAFASVTSCEFDISWSREGSGMALKKACRCSRWFIDISATMGRKERWEQQVGPGA